MAHELDVRPGARVGLLLGALALLAAAAPARAEAQLFSAKEMRGRVLDAETGAPIRNAAVVALWLLRPPPGLSFEPYDGRFRILETLTDENGEWRIPGWGPRLLPPFKRIDDSMPRVGAWARGYRSWWLQGRKELEAPNALDLPLKPARDARERASVAMRFYYELLGGMDLVNHQDWPNYPKTTVLMMREWEWLKANGAGIFGPGVPERADLSSAERALLERTEREVPE